MEIGVITGLREDGDCFAHVSQFGLHVCQLACGRMNRLPPVTSSSTILVTVTLPICHFIALCSAGGGNPSATQSAGATENAADFAISLRPGPFVDGRRRSQLRHRLPPPPRGSAADAA